MSNNTSKQVGPASSSTESLSGSSISAAVPSLSAENLTKTFGPRVSVDKLNLKIYPGELYALLGDNGAGKTTTIGMLTTLIKPSSGTFSICGHDGLKNSNKIRGLFGVVSQDVSVYHELTVYENLRFLAELYGLKGEAVDKRIEQVLVGSNLVDRLNDRAGNLSGGMQRRLAIACAMINEPKVLFMDEPTVGLDPAARREIWTSLKDLKKLGVTVLLTTHYLEEAEILADRIGIIRSGKLVIEGTVQDLSSRIQGMRGLALKLADGLDVEDAALQSKLEKVTSRFTCTVRIDKLRNTLYLSQPDEVSAREFLRFVFDWLESEAIPFIKFASGEPNLEDVFMAVTKTHQHKGADDV
ncbi:MAG: ABC transporter ATP-binding protein [Candidatus Melainabacteria bacterium]|nr:ABC transporter ATP-binding protein [Candidatus Melainabacteria bacterium]